MSPDALLPLLDPMLHYRRSGAEFTDVVTDTDALRSPWFRVRKAEPPRAGRTRQRRIQLRRLGPLHLLEVAMNALKHHLRWKLRRAESGNWARYKRRDWGR